MLNSEFWIVNSAFGLLYSGITSTTSKVKKKLLSLQFVRQPKQIYHALCQELTKEWLDLFSQGLV